MVDPSSEVDLRRLEGVVCGEVDGEEENATGVWRITLRGKMLAIYNVQYYECVLISPLNEYVLGLAICRNISRLAAR